MDASLPFSVPSVPLDSPRPPTSRTAPALLLVLAFAVLFLRLGELGLAEPSEGRYAEVGREMCEGGDYVTPRLNYQRHFEKPPFAYWMIALGESLFGATNFGARCMGALAGTTVVALVFAMGAYLFDATAGWIAGLVLLAQMLFFVVARSVTADIYVAFWSTAAVHCFVRWYGERPADLRRWRWGYYACLGGGLLTKGPVIFVLALLPVLLCVGLRKDGAGLKRLRLGRGLALSACMIALWLLLLERATPGAAWFMVFRKATSALTSSKGYHAEPFWYYVPVLVSGCMPWSFFLPAFWAEHVRPPAGSEEKQRWGAFLLDVWWPAVFLVFSVSASKLMTYLLPVTIPIALANGRLWSPYWTAPERRMPMLLWGPWCVWFGLVGALTLALAAAWFLPTHEKLAAGYGFIPWLIAANLAYGVALWTVRAAGRRRLVPLVTVAYLLVLFQVGLGVRRATEVEFSSVEPIGEKLRAEAGPGEKVVCYHCFIRTVPYYVGRRVLLVDYDKADDQFDKDEPGFEENVLYGLPVLMELVKGPERVWVVTKVKFLEAAPELAAGTREVERNGSVVLRVNR